MKRTVEKTVLTGFVVVLAMLGTVGVVTQRTIVGLIDDSQWVSHTHIVLELLQRLSFKITQAEASVRGFVITGDERFESQYDAAKSDIPGIISDLARQTLDNPKEQNNIVLLDALIKERFATMDLGIKTRHAGGLNAVLALPKNPRALQLSSLIANLIGQMRNDENELLSERNARAEQSSRRAFLVVLLAVFLAMLAVVSSLYLMFRDLTRRREVDRLKSEFVSVVSHELRTPLTSIHGSLGLLASGMVDTNTEKGKRMLDIAVNNTERLIRLINDILDIEKLDAGKIEMHPVVCNAGDLIRNAWDVMRAMAHKYEITLRMGDSNTLIMADPDRMAQCLTNLLSNAIKFSQPRGVVTISAVPSGSYLRFEVSDQGRGIAADKQQLIFERFQQVDTSDAGKKAGTGLGLAITRTIVQQHGGTIWLESRVGKGSRFFFTIPLAEQESTFAPERPVDAPVEEREANVETHPAD